MHTPASSLQHQPPGAPHHTTPSLIQVPGCPLTPPRGRSWLPSTRPITLEGAKSWRATQPPQNPGFSWGGAACPWAAHLPSVALRRCPSDGSQGISPNGSNQTQGSQVWAGAASPVPCPVVMVPEFPIIAPLNPHGQFGSISINNVESFLFTTGQHQNNEIRSC